GDLITSWEPSLNAQGLEIKASADGATIFVGGDFDRVNGEVRTRVAAIDAQTGALRPWNPAPNGRVDAIAVHGNVVYLGGDFTRLGTVARMRLAAVDASSAALLPWAPEADKIVNTMVVHPASGRVIVGGTFNTLNGSQQFGMGSLDAASGAVRSWPVNTIIKNHDGAAAISSLTTDGQKVYGVGWTFLGDGGTGNFEGVFAADAATGALDWVIGGRGDNYDLAASGNVLYTVGHPHDWGMVDWNPQTSPLTWQRAAAIDTRRSPTLTNAFGTPAIWRHFPGRPAAQPLHWLPTLTGGTYTGQGQAAWSVDTNGTYTVLGGEFPRVNGVNQQGLVRFAKRAVTPAVAPVQGLEQLAPVVTSLGPGTVRLGWTAAWDRDNARLRVEVLRGSTAATSIVVRSFETNGTKWWDRPPLGFVDTTSPPGSSQTYRIRVTDPFGNGITSSPTTVTIPAGAPATSTYAATVLADNPSWQWRLGEASGTNAYDRAGSNDLTLNGAQQRGVAGAILNDPDTATNFPGTTSTSAVQGASSFWQSGPQAFSLEAWFRTSTNTGGKILGFGERKDGRSSTNVNDRNLYMSNAGQIYFGVRPDMRERITINSPDTYNDNEWHHAVATLGADGMKLYVDGTLVANNAAVSKAQVYRGYWRLGGDQLSSWLSKPTSEAIRANLDEIAVYPYALTPDRVATHYAASGRTATPPNSPPTASFTSSTQLLTASFDGSASRDSDGTITAYNWNFGDGRTGSGVTVQHSYASSGTYTVTLTVRDNRGATGAASRAVTVSNAVPPPPPPPPPERSGYWMVGIDGAVFAFGTVPYLGGVAAADVVDIEPTPTGNGYWIVTRSGALFSFGDAPNLGDARGRLRAGERVVSMSTLPANNGYWLFTDLGRVLPFGGASFLGDLAAFRLNGPVLGSISTPTGRGYYMVASDGGVFSFGDAAFYGSMGGTRLNQPVMGLVPDRDNVGYWLVARDGGVFAFDAPFLGSTGSVRLNRPIIGMVGYGNGYLMVGEDGGIFNFSDKPFVGSLGGNPPSRPIVSVAAYAGP
ncbi:MAG: PKD domain-containing protein, partial [Acidimicrobiia bacterium]